MSASSGNTNKELKKELLNYKVGNKIGQPSFSDAQPGEMDGFQIRIGVFGITGAGKSALINTIYKILKPQGDVAVVQSAGGEGTVILEEFFQELRSFVFVDTRGFFDINTQLEETEFFRILYGSVKPGEMIDRKLEGKKKTACAGVAGHKLNKPPLSRQIHVVLWVISASDIRLINEEYQDTLNFVLQRLGSESITVVTVITHSDILETKKNVQAARDEAILKCRGATKSLDSHTFLVQNWTGDTGLSPAMEQNILDMVNTTLACGERSVKVRQSKRRMAEKAAQKSAEKAAQQNKEGKAKTPQEDDEQLRFKDKNVNFIYNKF